MGMKLIGRWCCDGCGLECETSPGVAPHVAPEGWVQVTTMSPQVARSVFCGPCSESVTVASAAVLGGR